MPLYIIIAKNVVKMLIDIFVKIVIEIYVKIVIKN